MNELQSNRSGNVSWRHHRTTQCSLNWGTKPAPATVLPTELSNVHHTNVNEKKENPTKNLGVGKGRGIGRAPDADLDRWFCRYQK